MWQEKDKQLYRKFEFKDFEEAFGFMTQVAVLAEQQNHHPRWQNEWNKVEIWLSNHSKGQITGKDQKLAQAIDQLFDNKKVPRTAVGIDEAKLYTDGGSRGNPGVSAGAFVICKMDDNVVEKSGFYLGIMTNNQAEYQALLRGLQRSVELKIRRLKVFMDSELIIKQLNGLYKVKNKKLELLYRQVKELADGFEAILFTYVPRAHNKEADTEVNRILDKKASKKSA
ncbi:4a-hydroxytetrahydrobiopterin dehydratase [Candidatus Saccharibacteria bacterium]|nr:4a-hydroxytetrahydrobiopterin dehydratase [Candidatus Saccharibacteria bacterium]